MSNEINFCENCGNRIIIGSRFCGHCGYDFGIAQQPQVQQVQQAQRVPQQPQVQQVQQAQRMPQQPQFQQFQQVQWVQQVPRKRRSKKPLVIAITFVVLAGSLAITGFGYPGFIRNMFTGGDKPVTMIEAKAVSARIPVDTNGKGTTVGSVEGNGFSLHVEDGTFSKEGTLTVTPFDEQKLSKIENKSAYEFLSTPVEVKCDAYSGGFFAEDVVYTVPMPKDADDLGRYVFGYFEEETGEVRYLEPDSFDLENGTMSVVLPHFSNIFSAKLTKAEEKERFLNEYSMKLAIEESEQKRAAAELEPYVKAKVAALGLTKKAAADLVQSTVNYMSGCYKDEKGKKVDWVETAGKGATSIARGFYENDMDTLQSGLEDTLNGALMHAWDERKFSEKLDKVLGSEFAGSTTSTLLSSSNGVARMAGRLVEGDMKGAAEELGGVMQNVHPSVELCTKSAVLLVSIGNTAMVNWKSNMVDEMYNIYKNGARGLFGIEVKPNDRESFLAFFNNEIGGIYAYRGVSRFYNLDKIAEVCERYGWEEKTYNELSDEKKAIFNKRATDSLMEYFDLRMSQEKRAAEIKEVEGRCIETMLNSSYGVLDSSYYREFFGEESASDYSLTRRLERLVNVRRFISQYIDLNRLEWLSDDPECTNMGDLLNEWVMLASKNPKSVAIDEFIKFLKEQGLLNKEFDFDEPDSSSSSTSSTSSTVESSDISEPEVEPMFEGGIDAFMGEWYEANGRRTILYRNGDNVIVKQPDLPWYGGDVSCTEYTAELDESTATLTLKGITTWVSSSLDSDERQLEMDASSSKMSLTATEFYDGGIMAVNSSGKTLTR